MASNGYISNNFRTGYKVQIYWTLNSQNIANNTSNITVNAQLVSTGGSYNIVASATKYGSLTINGTTYNFTFNASLSGNQTKTVYSKTIDIPHNSDGTKTVSMSTTLGINVTLSGTYYGNVSTNGSGDMNYIPRTSSISLSTYDATIGSTKIGVNINRASDSFTHKVYYRFGSINWLVDGAAATYAEFTPSINDCSQIPNSTSGTATIYVETWSGGTLIGSTSAGVILNVPGNIVPTFSSISANLVPAGADASYGYVKGKSKCRLVINGAAGSYGSTIKSFGIWGGGFSSYTSDYTTDPLPNAGNITFTGYVVDSRGRQSADKTITINVQDYTNPNITSWTVIRCLADGTANDDGTYLKITPNYTYTTLGGKNSLTSNAQYKPTDTSVWVDAGSIATGTSKVTGSGNISTGKSFDVKFTVSDNFTSINRSLIIPTAFATMDFKKGGKGIAIGKAAEHENLFDIAMNTKIKGTLTVNDVPVGDSKYLPPNTNLNDIKTPGMYQNGSSSEAGTMPNIPLSTAFSLFVEKHAGVKQTFSAYDPSNPRIFVRNYYAWDNVWGPWIELVLFNRVATSSSAFAYGKLPYIGSDGVMEVGRYIDFHDQNTNIDYAVRIECTGGELVMPRLKCGNWYYSSGATGWYNETYGGGIYQDNNQWVKVYGDKGFYTGGRIKTLNAVETRYIDAIPGQQLDISTNGDGSIFLNVHSPANANAYINKRWAGSEGGELSFYNSRGNAYGFLGNSGATWFRVYGYGGSVSYRANKYDISKADTEQQYQNIKELNIYNYRSISDERDEEGNVLSTLKRQDLFLGCMVDELPLEATFYDNEGGDGKAVDMYSYTTMILGATKELINKTESLEDKVDILENKVDVLETEKTELISRLEKLEAIVNGLTNN